MPIHHGKDKYGHYFQWGHQFKYYYNPNNKVSEMNSYNKAVKQAQAIHANARIYRKKYVGK